MQETSSKTLRILLVIVSILVIALIIKSIMARRSGNTDIDQSLTTTERAVITSVDIRFRETFPVQVELLLDGVFSTTCEELGTIDQIKDATGFTVDVFVNQTYGTNCEEREIPFVDRSVLLEGVDTLYKGEYSVNVNGISKTFILNSDNIITDESLK